VLSKETKRRIDLVFQERDRERAATILDEGCNNSVAILKGTSEASLERVHFAALKLSEGDLDKLRYAVDLAQKDWRDLLVYADFGTDVEAHKRWLA
jgi:hypothetical protein